MLEGLYSAAAGMSAQQEQLDAVSNDLANISTSGYQSERVAFSDLLYNAVDEAGTESSIGSGASAQVIGRSHAQGPGGQPALTRDGSFAVDAGGTIVDAEGNQLEPPIKLPAGVSAGEVKIGTDGSVTAGKRTLGQIKLVTVASPDHLLAGGGGTLTPTTASGAIQPLAASGAKIRQGALEGSNVDMSKEMALMVSTQRAYQMSSSAIQTESQMMSIANELRPS
jgi:flagellar basal-body rod protein FlgG